MVVSSKWLVTVRSSAVGLPSVMESKNNDFFDALKDVTNASETEGCSVNRFTKKSI